MDKSALAALEAERTREESIKLSRRICELTKVIDVNDKEQMKLLRELIIEQSAQLSPVERLALDRGELRSLADSLVTDDLEVAHQGLMTSLRVLGKLFIKM